MQQMNLTPKEERILNKYKTQLTTHDNAVPTVSNQSPEINGPKEYRSPDPKPTEEIVISKVADLKIPAEEIKKIESPAKNDIAKKAGDLVNDT